ncbi:TetR/AcrR family transcriptional regulator [Mycolicibacterium palauense]|uniref:TetR/AcrR family transcriptional regulator n=1 Tax=Mycolicibacterium palauense TaxID=2034511 RepID=UPI000BFEDCB2|nr:TetR/AcrR family transcriptional regulator [Mycolicibacterium palauense]
MPAGELSAERRRRLLEVAAREFAARGYEQASLNAIIREASMRKSSFYHFVGSKAALFDAVVREAMTELAHLLDIPAAEDLAGPHFWARVTRLVTDVLAVAARGDWLADVGRLFYLPDAPVEHSPVMSEVLRSIGSWVRQALTGGRACGAVRDDMPMSSQIALVSSIVRCLDEWSLQHLHEYRDVERDEVTRMQIDALRRLLGP